MSRVLAVAWRLILVAVALVALGHFVFYLYVWEWARAQIAGTALVAMLVVGSTFLILARLDRMQASLEAQRTADTSPPLPPTSDPVPAPPSAGSAADRRPDFPWLADGAAVQPQRYHVFIPVLLAAGLVASVAGGLVERLSAQVARRAAARTQAQRTVSDARARVVVAVVTAIVLGLTVQGLWTSSHFTATDLGPGTTSMRVEVRTTSAIFEPVEAVDAVGPTCAMDIGMRVEFVSATRLNRSSVLLVLTPQLADAERRRYAGCLQDAQLERYWLHVRKAWTTPDPGPVPRASTDRPTAPSGG